MITERKKRGMYNTRGDELYMYNKRMTDDNGYYGKKQRMKDLDVFYTKQYRYVEK